jgi:hypothetical protein
MSHKGDLFLDLRGGLIGALSLPPAFAREGVL